MVHQGTHATFLDLDITIKDNIFIYKLFNKRDKFSFFIVRMPHLSSKIPSSIFYGLFYSELLKIAKCAQLFCDFTTNKHQKHELYNRMVLQRGNTKQLQNHARKMFQTYSIILLKYTITFTRSSLPEVFCKNCVLKNVSKFSGKHLCQSLFFNKEACNFIKKEGLAWVFSREF